MLEKFKNLQDLVNNAQADAEKAAQGNKAAGTRLRKTMQDVKAAAQAVRTEVLEARA